jgi:hypothetical protein
MCDASMCSAHVSGNFNSLTPPPSSSLAARIHVDISFSDRFYNVPFAFVYACTEGRGAGAAAVSVVGVLFMTAAAAYVCLLGINVFQV